jgi:hypothetical protein
MQKSYIGFAMAGITNAPATIDIKRAPTSIARMFFPEPAGVFWGFMRSSPAWCIPDLIQRWSGTGNEVQEVGGIGGQIFQTADKKTGSTPSSSITLPISSTRNYGANLFKLRRQGD